MHALPYLFDDFVPLSSLFIMGDVDDKNCANLLALLILFHSKMFANNLPEII